MVFGWMYRIQIWIIRYILLNHNCFELRFIRIFFFSSPGDIIKISAEIGNGSSRSIVPKAALVQKQIFYTLTRSRNRVLPNILVCTMGQAVKPNISDFYLELTLAIPDDAPLSIANCEILEVEYVVMVRHRRTKQAKLHINCSYVLLCISWWSGVCWSNQFNVSHNRWLCWWRDALALRPCSPLCSGVLLCIKKSANHLHILRLHNIIGVMYPIWSCAYLMTSLFSLFLNNSSGILYSPPMKSKSFYSFYQSLVVVQPPHHLITCAHHNSSLSIFLTFCKCGMCNCSFILPSKHLGM